MISTTSNSIKSLWREACEELFKNGLETSSAFRDSPAVLVMENDIQEHFDEAFPMSQKDIQIINKYLISGENESEVVHDWTKIYRKRLFGEDGGENQIRNIIEYLKKNPLGKRAQASIWRPSDINAEIAPCLQILWFQVHSNKLELHVHMRACDAYGKLLMNINEFVSLQEYVALELGIEKAKYIHFIDTLHFNKDNQKEVEDLFS